MCARLQSRKEKRCPALAFPGGGRKSNPLYRGHPLEGIRSALYGSFSGDKPDCHIVEGGMGGAVSLSDC
jgi:hypothetical protein